MRHGIVAVALFLLVLTPVSASRAQSTSAFTYQAALQSGGLPASGPHDMLFSLWDAPQGGTQVAPPVSLDNVQVQDGVFTVSLDFGAAAFMNPGRWLEINVEGFTLSPRQLVSRVPYSIQTRGIFVDEADRVGIGTTAPADALHIMGPQPTVRLENESSPGSFAEIKDGTAAQLRINKVNSEGQVLLDINPKPENGISAAQIRFFRETNTIGQRLVQFLRGNFTTAVSAQIGVDGADSFLQAHGGNLGVGTTTPAGRLDVSGDGASPAVRVTGISDVSLAAGGTVVVGSERDVNLALDNNEIMARDNSAPATLYLNREGGQISMGPHGIHPAFLYAVINADGSIRSQSGNLIHTAAGGVPLRYRLADGTHFSENDVVIAQIRHDELVGEYGQVIAVSHIGAYLEFTITGPGTLQYPFSFVVYRP